MSLSPLISLAGAAAGTFAAGVVGNLRNGLGFDKILGHSQEPMAEVETAERFIAINANADSDHERPDLQSLQRELAIALGIVGVDMSQPIVLRANDFGGVDVAGRHPDAEMIERLLTERPDLKAEIRELLNDDSLQLVLLGDSMTVSAR